MYHVAAVLESMPLTIDALPFDVLFNISSGLNFEDYVNLGDANRQLRSLLSGETICKRAVNVGTSAFCAVPVQHKLIKADDRRMFRTPRRRILQGLEVSRTGRPYEESSAEEKHLPLLSHLQSLYLGVGPHLCTNAESYATPMTRVFEF